MFKNTKHVLTILVIVALLLTMYLVVNSKNPEDPLTNVFVVILKVLLAPMI